MFKAMFFLIIFLVKIIFFSVKHFWEARGHTKLSLAFFKGIFLWFPVILDKKRTKTIADCRTSFICTDRNIAHFVHLTLGKFKTKANTFSYYSQYWNWANSKLGKTLNFPTRWRNKDWRNIFSFTEGHVNQRHYARSI